MRSTLVALLLLVVGIAAWWLLRDRDAAGAPERVAALPAPGATVPVLPLADVPSRPLSVDRTAMIAVTIEDLSTLPSDGWTIAINFQHPAMPVPDGLVADTGEMFAPRGDGLVFGWLERRATESRWRKRVADARFDSFIHFTKGPSALGPHQVDPSAPTGSDGAVLRWAIALADGDWRVEAVLGDPAFADHDNGIAIDAHPFADSSPGSTFDVLRVEHRVRDGRLVIAPLPGSTPKLCLLRLAPVQ